jgi:septal ring factor EnvC (AmiA/AmiB activator)
VSSVWLLLALAGVPDLLGAPPGDPVAQLEELERTLIGIDEQLRALRTREAALDLKHREDLGRLETTTAAHAQRRAAAAARLGSYYRLKRRGLVRLVFDADDPSTMRRRVRYLLALVRSDESAARDLAAARDAARVAAERVEADLRLASELRAELELRRQEIKEKRDARRALVRAMRADVDLVARWQAVRQAGSEDLRAVAAPAEPETPVRPAPPAATAPAAVAPAAPAARPEPAPVAEPADPGQGFRAARGSLRSPVRGKVLRGFGSYTDPTTHTTADNLGVDLVAPLGTPFVAVYDGVVARAGYVRGYGQVVTVQHGAYTTIYAHANGLRVAQGQAVKAGEVLGNVGNTGLVEESGARLHFEVRYNGTPQDPADWIGALGR